MFYLLQSFSFFSVLCFGVKIMLQALLGNMCLDITRRRWHPKKERSPAFVNRKQGRKVCKQTGSTKIHMHTKGGNRKPTIREHSAILRAICF